MLRLTDLVTGTCNECVSVAKKASLHVVYLLLSILQITLSPDECTQLGSLLWKICEYILVSITNPVQLLDIEYKV